MTKKQDGKKPVILICGYLGSGKTTFLNELLRQEKRRVSLVVNDMGSINVDAALLKKNGSNVAQAAMYELQNGCICCTLRDEFIQQMEQISRDSDTEAVFVEASGISDPGAIAASFLAYEEETPDTTVYLSSIVTVVDGDRIYREFLKDLNEFEESEFEKSDPEITTLIVDQMEFCNTIILNKCDLLTDEQKAEVIKTIRNFQPRAQIIEAVNAKVDPDMVLTDNKFDYEQVDSSSAIQRAINSLETDERSEKACFEDFGIRSFVFEEKKPFNRERFNSFVKSLDPDQIIRAKGYMWFSDADSDVQLFESAGRNSSIMEVSYWVDALVEEEKNNILENSPDLKESWDPEFGDRMNQIVFIGKGYDEKKMRSELFSCLDEKAIA